MRCCIPFFGRPSWGSWSFGCQPTLLWNFSEIMHSNWLKLVMWLTTSNQRALFKSGSTIPVTLKIVYGIVGFLWSIKWKQFCKLSHNEWYLSMSLTDILSKSHCRLLVPDHPAVVGATVQLCAKSWRELLCLTPSTTVTTAATIAKSKRGKNVDDGDGDGSGSVRFEDSIIEVLWIQSVGRSDVIWIFCVA